MFSLLKLPGSPIQLHPSSLVVFGWVPRKFTSICDAPCWLKNVCIRVSGWPTLTPDWPPSPKMLTNQLFGVKLPGLEACVPLSCVPPMMSLAVFTLTDRLWYCSVSSPPFIVEIVVGTWLSQFVQSVRFAPGRLRDAQSPEPFVNEPFSLHKPPSFAMKTMSGLNGVEAIACWSGCRLTPWVSMVMSVKFTPASTERWIARPFDRPPISEYCIAPPM